MDFFSEIAGSNFTNEYPADQPPSTPYPDPSKPGQTPPMNPTPDVPGTDAPEVYTGTSMEPQSPEQDESTDENE